MYPRDFLPGLGRGLIGLIGLRGLLVAAMVAASPAPFRKPAASPVGVKLALEELGAYPRESRTWLEAQVALAREGFSCGSIDGVPGMQTLSALQAFQRKVIIPVTSALDPVTREHLQLWSPALHAVTITAEDLAALQPLSPTWVGKAGQASLAYETPLEMIAERTHASPALIRRLNPEVDWTRVTAGLMITAPFAERREPMGKAASLHVDLAAHVVEVEDELGEVLAHFPVSIAARVEKRPVGELHVTVVIPRPDYTFDPEVFPESAEGRQLGRRLVVPPGPNNPVGLVWIGLSLTGYGIHGTPWPELVGRTESHGCFRLSNWDAQALLEIAWVGMPVMIEP